MDYTHYHMNMTDIVKVALAALLIDGLIVYMFYRCVWLCLLAYVPCIYISGREYTRKCLKKRKMQLESQIEEMLGCLISMLSTGYSLENAINETRKELLLIYDRDSDIISELDIICRGIDMNKTVEGQFREFAQRVDIDELTSLAEMVAITKRCGGDLIDIVKQTLDVFHNRKEVADEISTMIAAKKFENRIMNLMPVIMLLFLNIFSPGYLDVLYHNIVGVTVMTLCMGVYVFSRFIGNKIMSIEEQTSVRVKLFTLKNSKVISDDRIYRILCKLGFGNIIKIWFGKVRKVYMGIKQADMLWWIQTKRLVIANTVICILLACVLLAVTPNKFEYMLLIIIADVIGVPYYRIKTINKQIVLRNEQMLIDYPNIINRFILLLGAGVNMRGVWNRMCEDYCLMKNRAGDYHYILEEMLYSRTEMNSGVPEAEVYERFGRRIGLLPYMKLSVMLSQNLKKGNRGLVKQLRVTSLDALMQRRETLKKRGEEASAKLLFPMMLQFVLILVIVMFPALSNL